MTHFLTVPINENGIIIDENIDLEIRMAAIPPFRFTDVFIYSHGWWNTASRAVCEYNVFTMGFSKTLQDLLLGGGRSCPRIDANFSALAMGLHWPSMLSEDQNSVENYLEAASFFTMQRRADEVGAHAGYSLLRLLIEARQGQPPLRFHLVGHSFGCRVLCSALQTLASDKATMAKAGAINAEFNVALLQAAVDADSLAPSQDYGSVLDMPKMRMLVTTSQSDLALGVWYPAAQNLAHLFSGSRPALGFVGPVGLQRAPESLSLQGLPAPLQLSPLAVVNITPLHNAHSAAWGNQGGWAGQHSDINLPEIYQLLALFFGNG